MRVKIVCLLLLILSVSAGLFNHGSALGPASASNITVRPFLQELKIKPGETQKQFDLTISNDSNFVQLFRLSVINFGSLNETGGLAFEGANINTLSSKYGLVGWLKLEKDNIELGPNQQTTIKATISNDADLSPGAHYAAIVTTASKQTQTPGQLTINPKVSSLIFATKLGGEVYNIHLSSVSHNGNLWHVPTAVNLRIKSTGNTYIVPRGIVSLKQNKTVLAKAAINEQSSIVLPETIRSFDVDLKSTAKPKAGILSTAYNIQIDYRYDGINQYASKTIKFRVLNKVNLLILSLMFILVIIGFKYKKALSKFARQYIKQ